MRATDKIHRDIEEYLKPRGLFYDRRKNYYKNEGKPLDRIIGIPQLAQAVISIVVGRPDQARARPSSLLKDNSEYKRIYDPQYPINLYFVCAAVLKRVDSFLRNESLGVDSRDKNNLRFYLLMHAITSLAGKWRPDPKEVAAIDPSNLTDAILEASLNVVLAHYTTLGANDRVAKGPEFLKKIEASWPA